MFNGLILSVAFFIAASSFAMAPTDHLSTLTSRGFLKICDDFDSLSSSEEDESYKQIFAPCTESFEHQFHFFQINEKNSIANEEEKLFLEKKQRIEQAFNEYKDAKEEKLRKQRKNETVLHYCVMDSKFDDLKYVLENFSQFKESIDINQSAKGYTVLDHMYLELEDADEKDIDESSIKQIIELLISNGATAFDRKTKLKVVYLSRRVKTRKNKSTERDLKIKDFLLPLILKYQFKKDSDKKDGNTTLILCIKNDLYSEIEIILEKNPGEGYINHKNSKNETALSYVVKKLNKLSLKNPGSPNITKLEKIKSLLQQQNV